MAASTPPSSAASPVRVGVVAGLGVMGAHHLRMLTSMAGVRVAAVVDSSEERRLAVLDGRPGLRAFATLAEALDAVHPDFACIAVPAAALPALAHEAIAARVAVLVEKPLAATEEEALGLLHAAEEGDVLLAVGLVERFNPAVVALKERLERGDVGLVYQIHARRLSPYPARTSMTGVSLDLATHDLDVIRYLTSSEIARVYAETASRTAAAGEDLISVSLRMDSGITGVLDVNWLTPTKVRQLSVTAEGGMYVVDYLSQDLTFFEDPRQTIDWDALGLMRGTGEGDMTRYALARREPLRVEWETFLAALAGGRKGIAGAWDGLAALSAALAIQRAGVEHRTVRPRYRRQDRRAVPRPATGPAGPPA